MKNGRLTIRDLKKLKPGDLLIQVDNINRKLEYPLVIVLGIDVKYEVRSIQGFIEHQHLYTLNSESFYAGYSNFRLLTRPLTEEEKEEYNRQLLELLIDRLE
ncbi:MAG: hypothetical protein DRZ76_01835 [Candidatus Nealsonbacteria bacterium]|nr:MAG: hypothetical protein DRZ76_01835 [Candidatus Nealsonbacteria bacterium]